MSNLERAKQFMPFAALRGYDDVIEYASQDYENKKELSEEKSEIISKTLFKIKKGDMCKITYYAGGRYETLTGLISSIDTINKKIYLIKQPIAFEDIYEIDII